MSEPTHSDPDARRDRCAEVVANLDRGLYDAARLAALLEGAVLELIEAYDEIERLRGDAS